MPDSILGDTHRNGVDDCSDDSDDGIRRPCRPRKAVLNDSSDDEDNDVLSKDGFLSITPSKDAANGETSDRDSDTEAVIRKKPANRLKKLLDDEDSLTSPVKAEEDSNGIQRETNYGSSQPAANDSYSDSETSVKLGSRRSSRKSSASSSCSESDSGSSSAGEGDDGGISLESIRSKIVNKHLPPKSTKALNKLQNDDPERRTKSSKGKAPSRKAKEAALTEIHSETQRMIRERKVSLPYHKPKQRSLEDFLNRRKLAPTVPLKTTSDELAKVWKHVEEREKMAESFYRSASEDESDCGKKFSEEPNSLLCQKTLPSQASLPEGEACTSRANTEVTTEPTKTLVDDSEQFTLAIHSETIPECEEFPRLQLSEICESTPDVNSFENPETNASRIYKPVTSSEEKSSDSSEGSLKVHMKTDSVSGASANSVLLDDTENVVPLSEKVPCEVSSSYSLSEKINSLNLPIAKNPKISGDPDEVIDLDDLTSPGAFGLMQRFMKHAKLKPKKVAQNTLMSVTCSDVSECGDVVSINKETIMVKKEEPKPGEKLVVLKTTLQQKITQNRNLQLAKRMEEYKLYEEEFYGGTSDNDLEEELLGDTSRNEEKAADKEGFEDKADDGHEDSTDDNADSEDEDSGRTENIDNPFVDEMADESEQEDAEQEEEGKSDIEDTASVLLGDDDRTDDDTESSESSESSEDEEDEHLSVPPIPAGLHSLAGTQNACDGFGESQLAALCSGDFSSAAAVHANAGDATSEVANVREVLNDEEKAKSDMREDSDDEVILEKKNPVKRKRKLSFSDEEDDSDAPGDTNALVEDDDVDGQKEDDSEKEEEKGGDVEVDIDDDQEVMEDDEEMQLAKKLSKGFLEKEAELSESEWGSDDEDERGLDTYEEEEGDKDKISQRRLQKELGKIHMREVLADDSREVRLLQELLLEDGELHSDGPKRQRLFRWYNQDKDNANEKRILDFGENGNENDEEDEETWRRQRLERENFLRKKKIDNLELEIVNSPVVFNDTRKGKVTPKMTPNVLKSPDVKSNLSIFVKRGSFLGRGEKVLSKLAEITNSVGSKENPVGNSRSNRNMVFSALSPPKEPPAEESKTEIPFKRKGEFLAPSVVKKIKFNSSKVNPKVSALEQLKLSEA